MPTRNVVLTDHQAAMIERLVASGRYQNASEVLRDGLRLIESRDAEEAARLEALREAVNGGIRDIEAGQFTVLDSAEALAADLDEIEAEAIAAGRAAGPLA